MASVVENDLQSTQSEHDHQGNLLLARDIDGDQGRDGNGQDDQIGRDMHTGIGEPQTGLAQTEAGDGVIPEFGDRDAIEERTDHGPGTVNAQDGDHDPAGDAHALGGEDAEVLQQDGCLCAEDGGVVEGDSEPEGLGSVR